MIRHNTKTNESTLLARVARLESLLNKKLESRSSAADLAEAIYSYLDGDVRDFRKDLVRNSVSDVIEMAAISSDIADEMGISEDELYELCDSISNRELRRQLNLLSD